MSRRDKKQEKRKKKLEQRRKQAAKARHQGGASTCKASVRADQLIREIDAIIDEAQSRSTKVVTFGALVLFSTDSGDAWVLDPEDASALCLARDGERQRVDIVNTGPAYQIGWSGRFSIEGEGFVVTENPGRVRTIVGYPTEAVEAHCRLAQGSGTETMQAASSLSSAGPIDWELALRDVPTESVFEGLSLDNPGDLDEAVSIFCTMLEDGSFAQWEAVIREEQGLPLSKRANDQLDELVDFEGDDEQEDRILYIDECARPSEPWYATLRRLADALLIPIVRTDHDYSDAQMDGWPMVEDYLESHSGELSLPPNAGGPLDVVSPDVLHRLRVQSALCELVGIGQGFRHGLTLANPDEHYRVDELTKCLTLHRASVEALGLTLQGLTERVELPPGEAALLTELLVARLGPLAPDEPLARWLPRDQREAWPLRVDFRGAP
jgi:hypothetical protein